MVADTPETPRTITVDIAGTAPIAGVDVVENNTVWRTIDGTHDSDAVLDAYTAADQWTDDAPITGMSWDDRRGTDGDVYVVGVRQARTHRYPGMAWVGAIWVEAR